MIDRDARNRLLGVIEDYMDDKCVGDPFESQVGKIAYTSRDETVSQIVDWLENFSDDCLPRRICVTRHGWQLLNRFRLLLASDAEFEDIVERRRSVRQVLAACVLIVSIIGWYCICFANGGMLLFGWSAVLGGAAGSFLLLLWRKHAWAKHEPEPRRPLGEPGDYGTFPFDSLGEILALRRTVAGFSCRKYRKEIAGRDDRSLWERIWEADIRIFPRWCERVFAFPAAVSLMVLMLPSLSLAYVLISPFLLIYQMLPETRRETVLRLPG